VVRHADLDILKHVNNAAYWAVVEQWLPPTDGPRRFRLEYGSGLSALGPTPVARATDAGDRRCWWWLPDWQADGDNPWGPSAASAFSVPLPSGLYPP
jgi:hypothetical protein